MIELPGAIQDGINATHAAKIKELTARLDKLDDNQPAPAPLSIPPTNGKIPIWMNVAPPFHHKPEYEPLLAKFGTVRFMKWMLRGDSSIGDTKIVDICKRNNIRPWINIDFTKDKKTLRKQADEYTGLNPIVEMGNEIWQGEWQNKIFNEAGISDRKTPANQAKFFDEWARQHDRIVRIWTNSSTKLYAIVLCAQENNPRVAREMCERLPDQFDALACTAYFGNKTIWQRTDTPAIFIGRALDDLPSIRGKNRIEHVDIAREYGAEPWIYEAGPHITISNKRNLTTELVHAINDNPAMKVAVLANIKHCEDARLKNYTAFNFIMPQIDNSGFRHFNNDGMATPKGQALLDYISN
jgi:hypothetical protein